MSACMYTENMKYILACLQASKRALICCCFKKLRGLPLIGWEVASVIVCTFGLWKGDVEGEINGHEISLLKPVTFPSPRPPARAAGWGGCSPQPAAGERQIKPDLPTLAETGGVSETTTSAHLSDCPDLIPLPTTCWVTLPHEAGPQAEQDARLPSHPLRRCWAVLPLPVPIHIHRAWKRTGWSKERAQGTRLSHLHTFFFTTWTQA